MRRQLAETIHCGLPSALPHGVRGYLRYDDVLMEHLFTRGEAPLIQDPGYAGPNL